MFNFMVSNFILGKMLIIPKIVVNKYAQKVK